MRLHTFIAFVVVFVLVIAMSAVGVYAYIEWDTMEQNKAKVAAQSKKSKAKEQKSKAKEEKLSNHEKQVAINLEKSKLIQEENRLNLERQMQEEQERSRLIQQKEKLAELQKKQRMEEDARRLGSLSKGELLQAQRALALVKLREDTFERMSPDIIRRAALIDPDYIEGLQRKLGEKRLMMQK